MFNRLIFSILSVMGSVLNQLCEEVAQYALFYW